MQSTNTLGFQFKQIHDAFEAHMNKQLHEMDLTLSQMSVLWCLFNHQEKSITQKDIERFLGLKHPTVIGILKRMERKGFICSRINESDHRYKDVSLTDKAFAVRTHMEQSRDEMESRLIRGITPVQIESLSAVMDIIYKNISTGE